METAWGLNMCMLLRSSAVWLLPFVLLLLQLLPLQLTITLTKLPTRT